MKSVSRSDHSSTSRSPVLWACHLFVLLMMWALPVQSHDARPLSITLNEQSADVYRVVVRAPPTLSVQNAPTLVWPSECDILESAPLRLSLGSTSLVSCEGGLPGARLQLDYPHSNPSLTTLIRIQTVAGHAVTSVLPPDEMSWVVPEDPDMLSVAWQYLQFGFDHILAGMDHLLFVAGLLLLARHTGRIVLAVTGFTLAHSITLAMATFELVLLPVELVEALIALSIVFLAVEIIGQDPRSLGQRFPVLLSFVFGLLHGFGFASALGELTLPVQEVVTALLFFNIGVELGQLLFIAGCLIGWAILMRWLSPPSIRHMVEGNKASVRLGGYLVGLPAAFWFAERSHSLFLPL